MDVPDKVDLEDEIALLIAETIDREDAMVYIDDVVKSVGCTRDEAVKELDRQLAEEEDDRAKPVEG